MSFKGDVCRSKKPQLINREEANQIVGLLNCAFSTSDYHLDHFGISYDLRPARELADSKMPIRMEPLLTGEFCPKDWTHPRWGRKANETVYNIIRAVKQPPTTWTCTELPNIARLCELIDAFEPETGWSIGFDDDAAIRIVREEFQHQVLRLTLDQYRPYELSGWSDILQKEADNWREPINQVDSGCNFEISDAIVRLNRFLPWLIKLAGGTVEIE